METAILKAQILDTKRLSTNESPSMGFIAETSNSIYFEDRLVKNALSEATTTVQISNHLPVLCSLLALP
jgi:hypothetical protein